MIINLRNNHNNKEFWTYYLFVSAFIANFKVL